MTLGLILAIGESFTDLNKRGQASRMIGSNIKIYSKSFDKVFIFTYANEKWILPKNCHLIANKFNIPRFFYSIVMPIINYREFNKCDIFRAFQLTGGIPASIAKIIMKKKFIFNYGYEYSKFAILEKKYLRAILFKPLTLIICIFSSKIIVTAQSLAQNIPIFAKEKIIIIPNSVDTKVFRPNKYKKYKKVTQILFVGRLEPEKNLKNLILALSDIKNFVLTIIGNGSQERSLKQMSKMMKLPINFIRKVEYKKIPAFFQKSDIFILPSVAEGHSKVLLEAQSSGLACIVCDIPQNKDFVENGVNGIISKPTVKDISNSIKKLIKDKNLLRHLGKHARANTLKKYESTFLIKKEVSLLKSLI